MDRRPHSLEPLKRKFRPDYHIFFDVETNVGPYEGDWRTHTFRLGWAYFWCRRTGKRKEGPEWYRIENPRTFWEWVESRTASKRRLLLIAHNIEYDAFILGAFHILPEMGWELQSFYSGSHVAIYRWKKGNRTMQFVNNANWFKGSLASWGKFVGYPKLDVDPLTANITELDPYCKRDVEILYELWKWYYSFIDEHNLGSWGITVPSQAFIAYRHRFLDHKIWIHNDFEVLALERASYHGGRSECLQVGTFKDGPFYKLDVNSMYPWAMRKHDYPISLRGHTKTVSLKRLRYFLTRYCVIGDVTIWPDKPYFPTSKDGKIVYPVTQFRTVLTTPELQLAQEMGWIEKVHHVAWYSKGPIFKRYVEYLYPLKAKYAKEGNLVCAELTKLMLNSLYGKFGQRKTKMKVIGECDPNDFRTVHVHSLETGKSGVEYYFAGKVWWSERGGESYHSFPAIASHVTAHARIYLYKMVESVNRENVYYIDTDSLIVNDVARDRLEPWIQEGDLGFLKEEHRATHLVIHTPKDYEIDEEVRIKGIRKNAVKLDDNTFEQEMFPSIRGLLKEGNPHIYRTKKMVKVLRREITSGAVADDGFVHPWGSPQAYEILKRNPEVAEWRTELEGLNEALEYLPNRSLVRRFYDLKAGRFKTITDPSGRRCEFAQSQTVQETGHKLYGFEQSTQGAEEFGNLILQTIETYDRVLELESYLRD